jgi:hypothetical protein
LLVKQETRDPLLARAKKLIHHIAFNTAIPGSQVIHKTFIEPRLGRKCFDHRGSVDSGYTTIRQRCCGDDSTWLPAKATIPEKLTRFQHSNGTLLALLAL